MLRLIPSLIVVISLGASTPIAAGVVTLTPSQDNTLIQRTDPTAQLSNGQGDIFVGRTNQDGQGTATISIRRGLIQFDVLGAIPVGSIITEVSLTMRDVMGLNGDPTVNLHRLLQGWGEGTSFFSGGQGAPATNDDATWLYTFFNAANSASSPTWTTPGGDFSPTVSGSSVIFDDLGGGQLFTWSSIQNPQLIADVQSWIDNPSGNFGWLIMGDESRGQSAKRLNSRESATPPSLVITYTAIPEASSFALLGMGTLGLVFLCQRRAFATRE